MEVSMPQRGEIVVERLTGNRAMVIHVVSPEEITCRFADGRLEDRFMFEVEPLLSPKRQVISSGLTTWIPIARLPVRRSTTISPRCGMDTSNGSLRRGCEEKARSLFCVRA